MICRWKKDEISKKWLLAVPTTIKVGDYVTAKRKDGTTEEKKITGFVGEPFMEGSESMKLATCEQSEKDKNRDMKSSTSAPTAQTQLPITPDSPDPRINFSVMCDPYEHALMSSFWLYIHREVPLSQPNPIQPSRPMESADDYR